MDMLFAKAAEAHTFAVGVKVVMVPNCRPSKAGEAVAGLGDAAESKMKNLDQIKIIMAGTVRTSVRQTAQQGSKAASFTAAEAALRSQEGHLKHFL